MPNNANTLSDDDAKNLFDEIMADSRRDLQNADLNALVVTGEALDALHEGFGHYAETSAG